MAFFAWSCMSYDNQEAFIRLTRPRISIQETVSPKKLAVCNLYEDQMILGNTSWRQVMVENVQLHTKSFDKFSWSSINHQAALFASEPWAVLINPLIAGAAREVRRLQLSSPSLREAIPGEKWCFFETFSKALWPPPPPFIWTFVLFCGGYFLNAFLSIKNGSNKEKNIFGGINCRGRAPLNQRSFERCSKKFGHCSKICAMFKNSLFVYDGVP